MLQEIYRNFKASRYQLKKNALYDVRFFNFWNQENPDMWLYKFIRNRGLLEGKNKHICFYSTFGPRSILKQARGDVNVFFTGENLKRGAFKSYSDHFLQEDAIDFALGFEYFDDKRYLRFPLWIMYMFDPEADDLAIRNRCAELRHPRSGRHERFACHISRDDTLGIRTQMCQEMSQIRVVDCAGKLLHNCDDLWKVFADDKIRFISEYKFCICPENSNCAGYVTEKAFQSIDAGCIPVYWGSFNQPEPEVLNPDAMIFWEKDGDNRKAMDLIRELEGSQSKYDEFVNQSRLKDGAEDYVLGTIHELETRIRALL